MQPLRSALAILALLVSTVVQAQGAAWPNRPVRWIIPYPPGGITDGATRMVLQRVTEQTGWNIVVENKPGANSILGADIAAKAPPDGYTILTVIAALKGQDAAEFTQLALEYDPQPPFNAGHPRTARQEIIELISGANGIMGEMTPQAVAIARAHRQRLATASETLATA